MQIEITKQDAATPRLQEFVQRFHSRDILVVMATAVKGEVVTNFLQLEAKGNKQGWPSQHFYSKAAHATNYRVVGDMAMVNINMLGITQRYFGGDIHAGVNVSQTTGQLTKYLTIPARPEAYGHRAGEFHNLIVLWGQHGPYALAEADAQEVSFGHKKKDGTRTVKPGDEVGGLVMFWLVDVVHQKEDPKVLPSFEVMSDAALRAGESWIGRNN